MRMRTWVPPTQLPTEREFHECLQTAMQFQIKAPYHTERDLQG